MTTSTATAAWTVPHEVEGFSYLHLSWDVAKAWSLVAAQAPEGTIVVDDWARAMFRAPSAEAMLDPTRFYAFSVGVDTVWCLANDVDLTRPILIVSRPLSDGEPVTIPIDGYHRLFRAWHDGVETLPAIVLTAEQEQEIRIQ